MRIVIDMQGAQSESRFRGIGRYTLSLALAIARNAGKHEICLVLNAAFPESILDIREAFKELIPQENIYVFEVPLPVFEQDPANEERARVAELIREYFLEQLNPDVILLTSLFEGYIDNTVTSVGQFTSGNNTAVILYDLIPYFYQEMYLPSKHQHNYYMRKIDSLKKSGVLLSISKSSKKEGHQALNIDETKIHNISSSVDNSFCSLNLTENAIINLHSKFGLTCKMIMYAPGGFDVRKNFEGIIEAYGLLPKSIRTEHQLVIVSKIQEGDRYNLEILAKKYRLEDDELILTGYVSDEDLIALYNTATLFVFPSEHEGFGLPVLEAMACGAPVIGSNTTSIPEVIGWEEALFNPTSPQSIASKIEQVLTDEEFKNTLITKQQHHKNNFSWDKSAKIAISALEVTFSNSIKYSSNTWQVELETYEKNYALLIDKISEIYINDTCDEKELITIAKVISNNEKNLLSLLREKDLPSKITWRVEGPFDSSYSLALLNRETALALNALGHNVILHSTEGPGDFDPSKDFLKKNPMIKKLYEKSIEHFQEDAEVSSRNLYPPRVNDMRSRINLLHGYAWEETAFPQEWVKNFNSSLQGMVVTSKYVKKIMIDNGVTVPLSISGNGANHWDNIAEDKTYLLDDKHSFRFLHVSSCFPRKGADILLKSYGDTFTSKDDVVLVIKTFENPHNEIHKWLREAQADNPNYPAVVIIEEDLTESQLKSLYEQCHTLVGPSRAEGFGLPFAEAMLSGLAVITTGWSGQLDFCTPETAWLIDYDFTPAKTHFELFNSVWAEPSQEHLSSLMREVYELPEDKRREKTERGRKLLLEKFKWTDVAKRLVDAANTFATQKQIKDPKIGWITSWNTKCGIATYSEHLINGMYKEVTVLAGYTKQLTAKDDVNVHRCWYPGEEDDLIELAKKVDELDLNTLVIQFNYGFFNFDSLNKFLEEQVSKNRTIVVMLHATKDPTHVTHKKLEKLIDTFKQCDRLLVHSHGDLNRLKGYNLLENVALFPHGVLDWTNPNKTHKNTIFTVASYGFFLPHKGLLELIEAISLLVVKGIEIRLKMVNAEYPVPESAMIVEKAKEIIRKKGLNNHVELHTDFLPDKESLSLLAKADLIVFPYQKTGESSSAAVRYGLATEKPIAVTPLAIFDDVDRAVSKLPGTTDKEIAEGIESLMHEIVENSEKVQKQKSDADKWREAHRYSQLGTRLTNILFSIVTIMR